MATKKRRTMDRRIARITFIAVVVIMIMLLVGLGYLGHQFRISLQHQGMTKDDIMISILPIYIGMVGGFALLAIFLMIAFRYQKKTNLMLEQMVYTDEVTGGVSFGRFKGEVEEHIKKNSRKNFAIISIDVDKSKYIEEIFGTEEYT